MCVFLQKIGGSGCYLAKAVALSGRAIAFGLHDNSSLHYWLHLSNYINLQQNEIAQKTTHE